MIASADECDGTLAWPLDKAATRTQASYGQGDEELERAEDVADPALGPKGILPVPVV